MSDSSKGSLDDIEKDVNSYDHQTPFNQRRLNGIEKNSTSYDHHTTGNEDGPHLTEEQEALREAAEPNFTIRNNDDENAAGGPPGSHGMPLELVQSAKPSINNIKSVPNGGVKAWMQVVGSFFLFFNTWGIVNTFGVYQTYYETGILSSSTPSAISWIGSIQAFLLMLVGAITGPVYDAGYVHHLLIGGSFLTVLGQMMLSLCTKYWQVLLAQAVCIGIGCGCLFVPGVAILSTYFSTKIATATGLAAAGSSLGGVIYPIVFYKLQPTLGFAWATRVLGFMMLGTLVVSNVVMRVRVLPAGRRKFVDWTAFKEAPYVLYVSGMFLAFMGLYAPFFYVQTFAIETGLANPNLAFYLLSMINAASIFGRIIPGFVGDKIGPMNMIIPCALLTGVLCLCLINRTDIGSVIAISIFYGLFSGALVSLPPTIFVHLTKNRAVIGTRMGMGFSIISIGLLVGTPICGAILNASSFTYVWTFSGILVVVGTSLMAASRISKAGFGLTTKV